MGGFWALCAASPSFMATPGSNGGSSRVPLLSALVRIQLGSRDLADALSLWHMASPLPGRVALPRGPRLPGEEKRPRLRAPSGGRCHAGCRQRSWHDSRLLRPFLLCARLPNQWRALRRVCATLGWAMDADGWAPLSCVCVCHSVCATQLCHMCVCHSELGYGCRWMGSIVMSVCVPPCVCDTLCVCHPALSYMCVCHPVCVTPSFSYMCVALCVCATLGWAMAADGWAPLS